MWSTFLGIAGLAVAAEAQEIFHTTKGPSARSQCAHATNSPSYYFQPFSFTLNETVRWVVYYRNGILVNVMMTRADELQICDVYALAYYDKEICTSVHGCSEAFYFSVHNNMG